MTEKGFKVLKAMCEHFGSEFIESVVGARDPYLKEDYYAQIKSLCKGHNITHRDRLDADQDQFTNYMIAISWRWIIKPTKGTLLIVFHDSILPKYRGFNPLVSCLINGDSKIGVSAIFGSERYDEGEIIDQASSSITYPIKIKEVISIITDLYVLLALKIGAAMMKNQQLKSYPQNAKLVTYSLWRDESDYQIDWKQSSEWIARFVNSVGHPYRGASTMVEGKKIRVVDTQIREDVVIENRSPGKVIFIENNSPVIVCGKGLLQITAMQDEDGKEFRLTKFRVRFQ